MGPKLGRAFSGALAEAMTLDPDLMRKRVLHLVPVPLHGTVGSSLLLSLASRAAHGSGQPPGQTRLLLSPRLPLEGSQCFLFSKALSNYPSGVPPSPMSSSPPSPCHLLPSVSQASVKGDVSSLALYFACLGLQFVRRELGGGDAQTT